MGYSDLVTRSNAQSLIPEDVTREIFKGATEGSAFLKMARKLRNMKRGEQRLPVLSSLITANFVNPSDTGLKQTSSVAWADKFIEAEELAVVVPIPENVLDDADYDLWAEIMPEVQAAFGAAIDAAVFHGTNAPASWPDDLATAAAAAGNSIDLSTFTDAADAIMGTSGVLAALEADGYNATGHVGALNLKSILRGLRTTGGQFIFMDSMQGNTSYAIDGTPVMFPMNGAINGSAVHLFSGDWNQVVYSIRQDMTFKIFTEGVVTDGSGNIVHNLMQQDMVALRAVMRLGWQVPNPINRVQGTEASRYPVAILVP